MKVHFKWVSSPSELAHSISNLDAILINLKFPTTFSGTVSILVGCLTFVLVKNKPEQSSETVKDSKEGKHSY